MAYLFIEDFKFGMDRRRERIAGTPGTLWTGKNVHITRGGDIKRTKKFASRFSLPAGSHGLAANGEQLYVFDDTDLSASIPAGLGFQRLQSPSAASMTRILDWKVFQSNLYVIAEYDDGNIYHFLDGSRVTDWDTIADSIADFDITAQYMATKLDDDAAVDAEASGAVIVITASEAGTDFTISKSTTDGGGTNDQDITLTTVQANVAAVSEVQATGTVTVTGGTYRPGVNAVEDITVNGVSLLTNPVDWIGSNTSTAAALTTEINNNSATSGYTATASGTTVTIKAAPGTGSTPNGYPVEVVLPVDSGATLDGGGAADEPVDTAVDCGDSATVSLSMTFDGGGATATVTVLSNVTTTDTDMAGGVDEVDPVAKVVTAELIGTLEAADTFTITINGTDYTVTHRGAATGRSLYVHKRRIYSTVASIIRYCKINDATDWTTTTTTSDAGFINVSNDAGGAELLVGMEDYNSLTAVFSEDNVYIYRLSADNSLNELVSVLRNTGTGARHAVVAYGNRDVFYLDESGVRSVQARDSSGDASIDDIGTVIDPFVQEYVASLDESKAPQAVAAIEPKDKLTMLLVGGRVFVLSRYPKSKISAWTYIERDETFTDMVRTPRRLYARDDDTIYLYGGQSGTEYDDADTAQPVVELPFMSAKDEAGIKMLKGFDIGCSGEWAVKVLTDPNHTDQEIDAGVFRESTYHGPHAPLPGMASHVAFKITGQSAGELTLSNMAIHFDKAEQM